MFLSVFEFLSLVAIAIAISIAIEHITKMRSLKRAEQWILTVLSHGEHYPTEFLERGAADCGIDLFKRALRRLINRKELTEGYAADTLEHCVRLRDGSPHATCPRPLPEWAKVKIRESFVSSEAA